MQNGYHPEEITVLTGYVGQVKKLRKAFESNMISLTMSDRDLDELQKAENPFAANAEADQGAHENDASGDQGTQVRIFMYVC